MKSLKKILAAAVAAAMLFTGCLPEEETTPTDTLASYDELNAYLSASEDEAVSALEQYLAPSNVPEGMTLTRIEVQPERKFITYYYNLGRYEPTTEELAEEMVKDIDLSMFSFFPTSNNSKNRYTPEKAERTILKETDEYQFRWSYAGDGQALLEKGLEYYGAETTLDGQTYYITEVTERMLVANTPEGEGLDVAFYQVVWSQDDYLFFVKLPVEFAATAQDIPPYLQMEWKAVS